MGETAFWIRCGHKKECRKPPAKRGEGARDALQTTVTRTRPLRTVTRYRKRPSQGKARFQTLSFRFCFAIFVCV